MFKRNQEAVAPPTCSVDVELIRHYVCRTYLLLRSMILGAMQKSVPVARFAPHETGALVTCAGTGTGRNVLSSFYKDMRYFLDQSDGNVVKRQQRWWVAIRLSIISFDLANQVIDFTCCFEFLFHLQTSFLTGVGSHHHDDQTMSPWKGPGNAIWRSRSLTNTHFGSS
jgi:hypothetical protein